MKSRLDLARWWPYAVAAAMVAYVVVLLMLVARDVASTSDMLRALWAR